MKALLQNKYHIRPNYHTERLGISKLLGKLVAKYVSTKKKKARDLSNDSNAMFCVCVCVCSFS